ncbi:MAG: hypothetical protein IJM58_05865 [Muribaculaceae bacterium]|nr:hypothetical protein [Muribaculaceae bacterium]
MKRFISTFLLSIFALIGLYGEDLPYRPLVREGRIWVNNFWWEDELTGYPHDYTLMYYLELKGDTIINDNVYKKCYATLPEGDAVLNDGLLDYFISSSVTPCAFLREEDMQVFALYNLEHYPYITTIDPYSESSGDESLIYDFKRLRESADKEVVEVDGFPCYCFTDSIGVVYVESIGVVNHSGHSHGDLLKPVMGMTDGMMNSVYTLSHVLNQQGDVIYKGPRYLYYVYDVFIDGKIDISDVNAVINKMLGRSTSYELQASADVTGDGRVDIADVNAVINAMLGK